MELTQYNPLKTEIATLKQNNASLVFQYETPEGNKSARTERTQRRMQMSNEHPDMSGAYPDEQGFQDADMERAFRAGAAQMREMLARFVEQGGDSPATVIAQSMRANWVPNWGKDPGKQDDVHADMWTSI